MENKWKNESYETINEEIIDKIKSIKEEIGKVLIGQDELIELLLITLFSKGHAIIEGAPGIAKTLASKLLASTLDLRFSRIQFTPDLMPSDITGASIFNNKTQDFEFRRGPIFANIILTDEINRSPAKTQAALFEVMEEQQVTIDGISHKVPLPFMVLATQNPIEQEGTYKLPEAQQDRFMFKIRIGYLPLNEEILVLQRFKNQSSSELENKTQKILNDREVSLISQQVKEVFIHDDLIQFIAEILIQTRNHKDLYLGASTRAGLALLNGSKSKALLSGRSYVIPEDIVEISKHVLNHRIILNAESEMEGITVDDIINEITASITIPR